MALPIGVNLGLELSFRKVRFVTVDIRRRDVVGKVVVPGMDRRVALSVGFVARLATLRARPGGPSTVGMARDTVFPDSVVTSDLGTANTVHRVVDIFGVRGRLIPPDDAGHNPVLLVASVDLVLE